MSITNIEFTNYKRTLKNEAFMTKDECEKQIAKITYEKHYDLVKHYKDDIVEKSNIPYCNLPFYAFLSTFDEIPDVDDYKGYYYKFYKRELILKNDYVIHNEKKYPRKSFEARLLRTYTSLIRDYHFYTMLVESGFFDEVNWSYSRDTFDGKDIVITQDGRKFDISLHTNTKRGNEFKQIKNTYRHQYSDNSLELSIDLTEKGKCGDVFLYDMNDVYTVFHFVFDKFNKNICPICKSQLVTRVAKKGPYPGKEFWGCTQYPTCCYIRNK